MDAGKKDPVDWVAIRADWEKNTKGNRELARWYQISEGAIRKKAKKEKWAKQKRKSTQAAAGCVPGADQAEKPPARESTPPLVQAASGDVNAIIARGRNLVERLLDELAGSTAQLGELQALIFQATEDDEDTTARTRLMKLLDLPVRTGALKNLASALKTLNESRRTPLGKKEQQAEDAIRAAEDTDWGDDLNTPASAKPN